MKVDNEWIFGSPAKLVFHLKKENESALWTDSIKNIAKVLLKEKEKTYVKLTQTGNALNIEFDTFKPDNTLIYL